ncbi:MAG TPA: hypothetical protein VIR64_00425 [Pseudobacillus sp.]
MEKDKLGTQHETSNLHLKREANNEVLEISSTGYGLESVPRGEAEEGFLGNETISSTKEQPFFENKHE